MKSFSEVMSGPAPMSPSTSPAGDVSSSGALDTGTTPVYSMSGPTGPPVTYGPVRPMGASGPGVDPLQGSGDPCGRGQQQNPGLSFAPVSSATVFSFEFRWKWKFIWNLADRAVCHSEHSYKRSDLWSATWVFGCKWTDCQWSSCATGNIQHGPHGLADDETADAFDSEYDGLYDEVSTEYCTTNAWSTSRQTVDRVHLQEVHLLRS